jgi:DNA polymerase-3 subunit epsilon
MGGPSFCAIDFETANAFRGSPCAVGLVRVIDGEIVETRRLLMRPPAEHDWFDDFNVMLHGITPEMVRGEPRFQSRLAEILDFAGNLPLVAHNAAFDVGVIRDACDASELPWPNLSYACTLVLARQTYRLLSYSLPWVAEAAGYSLKSHHDPEVDAVAAARIFLDIGARRGEVDFAAILKSARCVIGTVGDGAWSGCHHRSTSGYRTALLPSPNPDADPAHPFYGREMVFTGALATMTRSRAWEAVAERGASPAPGVTKRTNILVVGHQDARKLRPGESLSVKARKAADLRAMGQSIELLAEEDFLQLLEM